MSHSTAGGKSHVPPSPDPDRHGGAPPAEEPELPGQDDDPRLAPLQERKERDAQRHLHREGPRRSSARP